MNVKVITIRGWPIFFEKYKTPNAKIFFANRQTPPKIDAKTSDATRQCHCVHPDYNMNIFIWKVEFYLNTLIQ